MSSLERWFPALFALPFLFATTMLEALRLPSELARWLVLAGACALAAVGGFQRGRRGALGATQADVWIGVVIMFFGVSASWAIDQAYSLQRTISLGLLYGASFWYFWGYADRLGEAGVLRLLLRTAAVVLGLNLLVFGALAPGEVLARRFQGFFENPNNLGLICSVSLPLAFADLLRRRGVWEWIDFSTFLITLLVCGSRTGLVSSVVGMAIVGGIRASRGHRLAMAFGGVVVIGIVALSFTSYFEDNVAREDTLETLSNRTLFWDLAKNDYIPERPWLGHGFGTDHLVHDYYGIVLSDLKLRGYGVMSSYYGLAVAVGIPATIGFFTLLIYPTLAGFVRYWRDPRFVALAAAVVAGLLVGITESAIYSVGNCFAYLFWTVFALMIRRLVYRQRGIRLNAEGALRIARQRRKRPAAQRLRKAATAAM